MCDLSQKRILYAARPVRFAERLTFGVVGRAFIPNLHGETSTHDTKVVVVNVLYIVTL